MFPADMFASYWTLDCLSTMISHCAETPEERKARRALKKAAKMAKQGFDAGEDGETDVLASGERRSKEKKASKRELKKAAAKVSWRCPTLPRKLQLLQQHSV